MTISVNEVAGELIDAFEAAAIAYAVGGALAYGVWGLPRGTNDVDFNVFVEVDELGPLFDVLCTLGIAVDRAGLSQRAREQGMFVVKLHDYRVDIFVPSIEFSWEASRTKKREVVSDRSAWVLSAEAVAVFKLLFFRGKDLVDLERLIGVQQQNLDYAYVRRHMVEMMGEDDVRVKKWDELVAEHGPPTTS